MEGSTTLITDPENPAKDPRKFNFDFSYWSHDGFKESADGYLEPVEKSYADQVTKLHSFMYFVFHLCVARAYWRRQN